MARTTFCNPPLVSPDRYDLLSVGLIPMKIRNLRLTVLLVLVGAVLLLVLWLLSAPRHPVALIRVVDVAGKPVPGAIVKPAGLRTKPGPYQSGWYGWQKAPNWPANDPVTTDSEGCARIPYPKYLFERIETGQLNLLVNHPDFVVERPYCMVSTTPPAGSPWRAWADYLWNRIRLRAII